MHREYHPHDIEHLQAHAFEAAGAEHHDHHHDHEHAERRSLYTLTTIIGLLLGLDVFFWISGFESYRAPFGVSLALVAALLGGARIVYGALEALVRGSIGADVALAIATIAAIILGEYFVAAEVVFIALVGEVLEAWTANRALRSIRKLFDQAPRTARVRRDGVEREIPVSQVEVGNVVLVRAGERVPVDGPVLLGRSSVDQSALTGEAIPVDKGPGDPVFTGTVNQFGLLEVEAEKVGRETTFGQVLRLVAEAQRRKAPLHRTADRLARLFLPVVLAVAGATLATGYALGWPDVWMRTVAVLVVACPCALILATPAAVMASMAWLARHGVVIKGGAALERLASCDTFAFDKTGTLTLGRPELAGVVPLSGWTEDDVLRLAASAEQSSTHPLAEAINRAASERGLQPAPAFDIVAQPGAGVIAHWKPEGTEDASRRVLVGNRRLLAEHGITLGPDAEAALETLDAQGETPLIVVDEGQIVGLLGVRDTVRVEAHDVIHDLKHLHIRELAILTGDRASAASVVAKRVHLKTVEAELLPADKARWIEERQAEGRKVAMIGDGINDAPALARADVGIALGGVGADLAAEAGDMVLMGDPIRVLPDLVRLSRAMVRVIRQNIIGFAFGLNGVAVLLAFLGILGPVAAAILHQAGSLLVLLNAMRLIGFGGWGQTPPGRWLRTLGETIRDWDNRFDPGHAFDQLLARWRTLVALALIAGAGSYATSGWTIIPPEEVGLLQRQGRFLGTLSPGLHLRLPPPFEQVTRLQPARLRRVEVEFRESDSAMESSSWGRVSTFQADAEALLWTGDGQLVELVATVQYRLDSNPSALRGYAFGVADAPSALQGLVESSVRSVVSRRRLNDLLTGRRQEVEQAVAEDVRQQVEAHGLGILVTSLAFHEVQPPFAVMAAYRDVSRAERERQTRINQGHAYRDERLAEAQGIADATKHAAEADRLSRLARAAGEADAFQTRQSARRAAPTLTDHRLYWDAVASALADKPKLILDPAQVGLRRHLIMPGLPTEPGLEAARQALAPSMIGESTEIEGQEDRP